MPDFSILLGGPTSILFVGNSFTFGRVDPVMSYNAANVRDLTAPVPGTSFANLQGSNAYEPHPWSGVGGLFKAFTDQAGIAYDVALSTRNAATLQGHYLNSNPAGWDLRGNLASQRWDTVVLQENSTQPLPLGAGTVTFAAGAATATVTVTPTGDTRVEADETVTLKLAAGSGYRTGTSAAITGTILNDDPTGPVANPALPTVTLVANPAAVLEDGTGRLVYTFTRSGPTTSDLTVTFAAARDGSTAPSVNTSTGDVEGIVTNLVTSFQSGSTGSVGTLSFTSGTGSVTIKAGQSTATLTLDPRTDATVENDESMYLTLSPNAAYNVGTVGRVAATIVDDDFAAGTDLTLPNVTLSLPNAAVHENAGAALSYQFARSGSTAQALTVAFTVEGTATLPGNDFAVTGANAFTTAGAASPNPASFNTYAVKLAEYARTGAADGAIPANPNANAAADIYLYQTWARPNLVVGALVATTDDTTGVVTTSATSAAEYHASLEAMTADLRAAYEGLAAANPIFKGVAPVGDAFLRAVQDGTATRNPYAADALTDGKVDLWWDDNLHASKYGSYLSGLTLFGEITGLDPRSLGAAERAAADLGITQAEAKALQAVAAATLGFSLQADWTSPGQVTELRGTTAGLLASSGSFGFSDSDKADTHTVSVAALTAGALGTLTAVLRSDSTGDGTGGAVNWTYTVDNAAVEYLAAGATRVERFLVTLADAGGGEATREVAVTINGTYDIPLTVGLTADTGRSGSDAVTGDARLDGVADAFATVTLKEGATLLGTANADAAGRWSFTPTGLSEGAHAISASAVNGDGDTGRASFAFTLDTLAPDAPAPARADYAVTAGRPLTIAGTAEAGATIALAIAGTAAGSTVADGAGDWSVTLAAGVAAGTQGYAVTATDAAGNASAAATGRIAAAAPDSQAVFEGAAGNDLLDASLMASTAVLRGGLGGDTLLGGSANDRLSGGTGADSLHGGAGNDLFFIELDNRPGGPRDTLAGGGGDDETIIAMASYQLTPTNKAEIARLRDFVAAGDMNAVFVSDIFHIEMREIESVRIRLDASLRPLTDAVFL